MNNDSDLATMNTASYREMVADSILAGIKDYYGID
jgi:N-acetylmuramoyl-L-alanine amidase